MLEKPWEMEVGENQGKPLCGLCGLIKKFSGYK